MIEAETHVLTTHHEPGARYGSAPNYVSTERDGYDAAGRRTEARVSRDDGGWQIWRATYDGHGRRREVTHENHWVSPLLGAHTTHARCVFDYDGDGRRTHVMIVESSDDQVPSRLSVRWVHQIQGDPPAAADPADKYVYVHRLDERGRWIATEYFRGWPKPSTLSLTRDDAGRLVRMQRDADEPVVLTRDGAGRLVRQTHGEIVEGEYAYDALGRPTRATAPSTVTTFRYEGCGALPAGLLVEQRLDPYEPVGCELEGALPAADL
jgi:YD repeat-containing protein